MKPAAFQYYCPHTLDEALALPAEHGSDAKPLAGGQSLIPAMNFRLAAIGRFLGKGTFGRRERVRKRREEKSGGEAAFARVVAFDGDWKP